MLVGKINFTSINANSRLQQRDRNLAFTGTLKPNISKSLLNGTSQTVEKGMGSQENNLWRKSVKYIKSLFKKDKQTITGGETKVPRAIETQKSLELGGLCVPHKVDWKDFTSIKGELIEENIKVVKNKDGKIVKKFDSYNGKTVDTVVDYDPITGNRVKKTYFNEDGKTVDTVVDYNPITGNRVKQTYFNEDGKTVNSVSDYDPITGYVVTLTRFNEDATIKEMINF